MSEPAQINKYIYETTVKRVISDTKKESRVEDGKTVEVLTPVEVIKNVKIALLKPDRARFKTAEIHYAKALSRYLKDGLLPVSLVQKRYANDGGPLSENEKNAIATMREKYTELQTEYFAMKEPLTEDNKNRRAEIMLEMNEINTSLREFQNAYSTLFENTAEAKAKSDVIEWWILNIAYIDIDEKGYKPFYGEGDFEARLAALDALFAKDDAFTNEAIQKFSYLISFWFTIGSKYTVDDFKTAEASYEENVTNYLKPQELIDKPVDENTKVYPEVTPKLLTESGPITPAAEQPETL